MDMLKVMEINQAYRLKAEKENYENENTMDVLIISSEVIEFNAMIGTEADILTFGEFTRRFEKGMEELKSLIES